MYPESQYYETQKPVNKPHRPLLIPLVVIGVVVVIIIITVIVALLPKNDTTIADPGYILSRTSLDSSQNGSYLKGNELYSFNGLAFYKVDLADTSKLTVLRSGLKLPVPRDIYWADSQGALMTFKESFAMTRVSELLPYQNIPAGRSITSYLWYVDFASGSVKQVGSPEPIPGAVAYSANENGFYYVAKPSIGTRIPETSLRFYNLATGQDSVVVRDIAADDIGSVSKCAAGERICFTGRDRTNQASEKLYAVSNDAKKTVVLDAKGRIFPTNDPDLYITIEQLAEKPTNQSKAASEDDHADDPSATFDPAPARLYNSKTRNIQDLGFMVDEGDVYAHLTSNEFYAFNETYQADVATKDGDVSRPAYRAGLKEDDTYVSQLFPLLTGNESPVNNAITGVSHGATFSLISDVTGAELLFGKQPVAGLLRQDVAKAKAAIDGCLEPNATDYVLDSRLNLFKVYFTDDASFTQKVRGFSDCVVQSGGSALVGYNYYFGGRSAGSGRIVSD